MGAGKGRGGGIKRVGNSRTKNQNQDVICQKFVGGMGVEMGISIYVYGKSDQKSSLRLTGLTTGS